MDPDNKTAPMFIARTIHAQYRPGVQTRKTLPRPRRQSRLTRRFCENNPKDDEAYKAVAYLYGAIKEDDKLRKWIADRAANDQAEPEKRAEAYVVLASKDWDCSFKITEQPSVKTTTIDPTNNKATVSYKKPKEQKDFDQAQMCVKQGLSEAENAIKFDPNNESAWSYKTNLLLEASKLAEMDGKTDQKAQYQKDYEAALKRTTELSVANQKRKEEEEKSRHRRRKVSHLDKEPQIYTDKR